MWSRHNIKGIRRFSEFVTGTESRDTYMVISITAFPTGSLWLIANRYSAIEYKHLVYVILKRCDAIAKKKKKKKDIANSSAAFFGRLCCHWLKSLRLRHQIKPLKTQISLNHTRHCHCIRPTKYRKSTWCSELCVTACYTTISKYTQRKTRYKNGERRRRGYHIPGAIYTLAQHYNPVLEPHTWTHRGLNRMAEIL